MKTASKKILIADDDAGIVDSITMMLEMMDYDVAYTYDGATVTEAVKNHTDLILLDIWMSGHDGREICKQLKSNAVTKDIPVLMISASRDIKQSALDAGADDFLEKPFEMDVLLNKVDRLIH
ncbi:response regulator [Mucilaginibacter arboris]|uniref:Response regulator n=1 Tax=Mucilaginibacter arboris TaxID=2682090 RepID=A0A7K1SVQ6_9SPHI|nr:response regulator [Mucilaginibacter arboris]MVN21405.1 response regulator [Mucilaginibacter arboris]